jgi:AraC-like DNA-binding protein
MNLYIKNMVCSRCIMVVKDELLKFGLHPVAVELGEVKIDDELTPEQKIRLNEKLVSFGFELIDDKKSKLIEKIKNEIIRQVYGDNQQLKINFSDHISSLLAHDYNYLSNLFSAVEGTTIEQYFIAQKIERVKELLVYDELSLSEISLLMNYSSVAHLSRQFKKTTGLTPSHFKQIGSKKRRPIEDL